MREELIIAAASKVHYDWCVAELKDFFNRMLEVQKNGETNPGEIYRKACFKNGIKRNDVDIDLGFVLEHDNWAMQTLHDYEAFFKMASCGGIDIRRFVDRNLTEEEIKKASFNYRDGKENILRKFSDLSAESKKENLEAAIGAYNVYKELCEVGITIDQMETDSNILNLIGVAIHTDWLRRNPNHPNESLKVSYDELDDWTKQQDITVFKALLDTVKKDLDKYHIEKIDGATIPDYLSEEQNILDGFSKKNIKI